MLPKPWYGNGLRFECTRCGNCCRTHGEYAYVYLAERDLLAIAGFLGLARADFLARYCTEEDGWIKGARSKTLRKGIELAVITALPTTSAAIVASMKLLTETA